MRLVEIPVKTSVVSRREWAAALALGATTCAALLATAGWGSLEHLEAAYLYEAVKPTSAFGVIFGRQAAEQMHQPVFALLLRAWASLFGTSELAIRAPSALFAAISVVITWRFARHHLPTWPALGAGLLVATNPLVAWYGRDCSPYALLAAIGAAAFWSADRAVANPSRLGVVRTALLISLGFYTHFHGAWLVVMVGFWLLSFGPPQRRLFWRVTGVTAVLCVPAIGLLFEKLFTSVQGLSEDQPIMRYSHALAEAVPEALRVLFGGEAWSFVAVILFAVHGAIRARGSLARLALIAAAVGIIAELHITWQLSESKGIVYVDIRHYIFLVPVIATLLAAAPRWSVPLVVGLQLTTSASMYSGSLEKPDARSAIAYVSRYATGPEHGVSFLPAPWYSAIVEYYLLGVCPGLVHGRSYDAWWLRETCALSDTPEPGTIYGFPFGVERVWTSRLRRELRWLWLVDLRDHRFGLPVAPSSAQEAFACWPGFTEAVIDRRSYGPWVDVILVDLEKLKGVGPPIVTPPRPVETIRAADPWPIRCPSRLGQTSGAR